LNVVADPGHSEVFVRFDAPSVTGGAPITSYRVTANPGGATVTGSASPLAVTGLSNGTQYTFTVSAVNRIGAGPASVSNQVTPTPLRLGTPRNLMVESLVSGALYLNWDSGNGELTPNHHLLEIGSAPGLANLRRDIIPFGPRFVLGLSNVPAGVFYLRVRAVAGDNVSAPSNDVLVLVGQVALPSPPKNLLGLADGDQLTLSWTNTTRYAEATAIHLAVTGSNANGDVSLVIPLPASAEFFSFSGVPPGYYRFEVYAANQFGRSGPTHSVSLAFPSSCSGPPQAPTSLRALPSGWSTLFVFEPPNYGPAVSAYNLNITGVGNFPISRRLFHSFDFGLDRGTYEVNLTASNSCGISAPASIAMRVSRPDPPTNLEASVNGRTVTLTWIAPDLSPDEVPTSYVIEAGTTPGLSNPEFSVLSNSTSMTFSNVPVGTYYVHLHTISVSGFSRPSNEIRVQIR
jgi:hypothetical protein